jgi:hypothetical protein
MRRCRRMLHFYRGLLGVGSVPVHDFASVQWCRSRETRIPPERQRANGRNQHVPDLELSADELASR